MLKAVKECVKNWLVTHERLYWYIVVGLAVLGFGIVTALGCAKLEQANAAVDVTTDIGGSSTTKKVYDLWEMDWSYWLTTGDADGGCNAYDNPEELYKKIVKECNYMWVNCPSSGAVYLDYYYSAVPFVKNTITASHYSVKVPNTTCYRIYVYYGSSGPVVQKVYGLYDNKENATSGTVNVYNYQNYCLGSSYDILGEYASNATYKTLANEIPRGNLTYPILPLEKMYSLDAPYTNFQRVTFNYGYEAEDLDDFYADWMTSNEWKYFGHLNNMQDGDLRYSINPVFLVQLPTIDYILSAFSAEGINLTVDGELSVGDMYRAFKCLPELVQTWFYDKKAPYVEYEFEYIYDLDPDVNGNFTYGLSFFEMEYLLKAFNSELLEEFKGYSADFRAIYMTFLHVECVTSMVETEREDVILYGKITTNQFDRGVYDTCIEVIPEIDPETMTPEKMDEILSDATQDAHDKYIKDLENRLDNLESQMGGMTSVDGAFADLEGSDLWTGFISLVNGLGSLAPAIRSLSVLTGAVFGFLPVTITGIMSTTLFAICVIAIIKAIRG